MENDNLKQFALMVDEGSGCLVQPPTTEYTYVLTAKHIVKGKTTNEIQVIRQLLTNGHLSKTAFSVIEIFSHDEENKDAAIIKIPFVENLGDLLLLETSELFEEPNEYYLIGHPLSRRDKQYSFRTNDITIRNLAESQYVEAEVDNRASYDEIVGQSGGGIIKFVDSSYYLAGIQSKMAAQEDSESLGRVEIMPMSFFDEIIAQFPNKLKPLPKTTSVKKRISGFYKFSRKYLTGKNIALFLLSSLILGHLLLKEMANIDVVDKVLFFFKPLPDEVGSLAGIYNAEWFWRDDCNRGDTKCWQPDNVVIEKITRSADDPKVFLLMGKGLNSSTDHYVINGTYFLDDKILLLTYKTKNPNKNQDELPHTNYGVVYLQKGGDGSLKGYWRGTRHEKDGTTTIHGAGTNLTKEQQ